MKYGFEMDVLAYVRRIPEERQEVADSMGVELTMEMERVFKECDVVSLNIPLTEKTDNIIDKTYLKQMTPNSILIKTARGGIVNEEDLVEALKHKTIRAAGVDVFRNEPSSPDHPFLEVDEIIKTPHIGGVSFGAAMETSVTTTKNLSKAIEDEKG